MRQFVAIILLSLFSLIEVGAQTGTVTCRERRGEKDGRIVLIKTASFSVEGTAAWESLGIAAPQSHDGPGRPLTQSVVPSASFLTALEQLSAAGQIHLNGRTYSLVGLNENLVFGAGVEAEALQRLAQLNDPPLASVLWKYLPQMLISLSWTEANYLEEYTLLVKGDCSMFEESRRSHPSSCGTPEAVKVVLRPGETAVISLGKAGAGEREHYVAMSLEVGETADHRGQAGRLYFECARPGCAPSV